MDPAPEITRMEAAYAVGAAWAMAEIALQRRLTSKSRWWKARNPQIEEAVRMVMPLKGGAKRQELAREALRGFDHEMNSRRESLASEESLRNEFEERRKED